MADRSRAGSSLNAPIRSGPMKGNGPFRAQGAPDMLGVRIWFAWRGQRVYEDLGPFDRYLAELVCVDMAGGYLYGTEWVHVERALIVRWLNG